MEILKTLKRADVKIKIALLVFFALFYVLAIPFPQKSRQFPQLIAACSLVAVVVALVRDFTTKPAAGVRISGVDDTELSGTDEKGVREKRKRFYRAWAIILVSVGAGLIGGFLFTTFLLFGGFAVFFGRRQELARNIAVAVAMTVGIYLAFAWLMGVPLLSGIL